MLYLPIYLRRTIPFGGDGTLIHYFGDPEPHLPLTDERFFTTVGVRITIGNLSGLGLGLRFSV